MSPEQARGKAVDRRADIWAFGVVLFEMLGGCRLFEGETVTDVLAAVVKEPIRWEALPASTPAHVRRLLGRCGATGRAGASKRGRPCAPAEPAAVALAGRAGASVALSVAVFALAADRALPCVVNRGSRSAPSMAAMATDFASRRTAPRRGCRRRPPHVRG
jgi:serine/threonine protein kinase